MDPFPALGRLTRPRPASSGERTQCPRLPAPSGAPCRPRRHSADRWGATRHNRRIRPPDARHLRPRLDRHFQRDEATVEAARWIVWEASQAIGARSASIQELYNARAERVPGMTVPAINLRRRPSTWPRHPRDGQEERLRRRHLRAGALRADLHLPASLRVRTSVLAGAIAAGWKGPVFIQGDHYQFNAKKYAADAEKMTDEIRKAAATPSPPATGTSTSTARLWWTFRIPRSMPSSVRTTCARPS